MFKQVLAYIFLFFVTASCAVAAPATLFSSPVGFWKTIDDVSGETKSIVQIEELPHHVLIGKIVVLFKNPKRLCVACSGDAHNKPMQGLSIISQLKQNPENKAEWVGGTILDPKNGKTYHCSLHLVDNGEKLNVRGYIGLPLFGRSQTWVRTEYPVKLGS
jgi:uncharacterized protein (DUF2147 family)